MYLVYYHMVKFQCMKVITTQSKTEKNGQAENINKNNWGKILKINVKSFNEL